MAVRAEVAVVGAGSIGIAVAYYLVTRHAVRDVVLVDSGDPMGLTSAQSGENYRNWWPHPVMRAFTDHSIDLMEGIGRATGDRIHMTRRGYALATRRSRPEDLLAELDCGYGAEGASRIRLHEGAAAPGYQPARSASWDTAPDGVDVLLDSALIRASFPSLAPDIATVLHIRRAGGISGQQLGQIMLEAIREGGGRVIKARVAAIERLDPFSLTLDNENARFALRARCLVNAAGPYAAEIAAMLGEDLPVSCVFQQKIAFEDRAASVPRDMPFAIDLDEQRIAWTDEEREILASDPDTAELAGPMPGGIHCRPDGGAAGSWVKMGWARNRTASRPIPHPPLDPHFPDLLLRGVSRLIPALGTYVGRLPRNAVHYGGYYTMTPENWPLIGPLRTPGAFVAAALSGFGTMAACASGALCAGWITGAELPPYAAALSLERHADAPLMAALMASRSSGIL